ncbi:MAG: serine/threonine-protein kinase, partial [Cyanobacteriota bacterium]|nr:serine/threonine-protein kinase [Cyanobacteriota bacterium]
MFAVLEMGSLLKGRYFIQHLLKPGERDRVYLALDQLQSGEICCVGELIANNAEEAARIATTFAPQLDRLKTLFHPQIQQLKEYWWQDEHLFFVQSYIEGPTARDRGPGTAAFNEPEIRQLLQQILLVLDSLHAQQIVHGDISPDNLQWKNPDNIPTLINFGVFRDLKTQLGIDPLEKKFSDRLRELPIGFLPPGSSEDLYALAVTAVVLLTGQDIGVLFNPQTQTWNWEDYKLVSDQLANALNRMLSPQTSDRFPTAAAMLHALNAPVAAPTFMPPPPPPAYQPPTPISTPPVGTAVASAPPSSPASGLKDWQKAAIVGGIIGAFVLGGMLLLRPSIWSQQVVE